MQLLIATGNPHKLDEIQAVITDKSIDWLTLAALNQDIPEPVEDGETFEDNAVLKAKYYARATGLTCIADDSGLEVDALGGDPGVRSARYAGHNGPRRETDLANNRLLMERLADTPAKLRTARFVCTMALVQRTDVLAVVRGTIEGRILTMDEVADRNHPERGRGTNGFGYDPLFLVPELNRTTAEISPDHKNAISHRGQAVRQMRNLISDLARQSSQAQ